MPQTMYTNKIIHIRATNLCWLQSNISKVNQCHEKTGTIYLIFLICFRQKQTYRKIASVSSSGGGGEGDYETTIMYWGVKFKFFTFLVKLKFLLFNYFDARQTFKNKYDSRNEVGEGGRWGVGREWGRWELRGGGGGGGEGAISGM